MAEGIAEVRNNYYHYDILKQKIVRIKESQGATYNILSKFSDYQWQRHSETKEINEQLCYKATRIKQVKDRNGNIADVQIIAWYAPSIPIPLGPKEYVGLPGLILELHEVGRRIYYATEIKFNIEETIYIPPYKKGTIVTSKEFEKITEGNYDYLMLQHKRN